MAWENRIVEQGEKPADQFQANPLNYRTHPFKQRQATKASLDTLGWIDRVKVNRRPNGEEILLDGHDRVWQALQNGNALVPYEIVELSENEEKIALAVFDPITEMAEVDTEILEQLLSEVNTTNPDMQTLLADLAEAEGLLFGADEESFEGDFDTDDAFDRVAELQQKWGTELGQIWEIVSEGGERVHRVMCGDSTSGEDVGAMLNGERPRLMVTDPPYGVEYDAGWRGDALADGAERATGKVANDDRVDWYDAWRLSPADVAYVWHADRYASEVQQSLKRVDLQICSQIIWAKSRFAISRGHYHWQHEPCWYAVRKNATAKWIGDHSQTTLWSISNPAIESDHGTQKPIECMARPIRNHEGDVYDPFLGSGTTLIAADQLGRTCYGVEIDPGYVAVTLERCEKAGLTPMLCTGSG